MQIGTEISWGAIDGLGLSAFQHELGSSDWRRTVKVYAVPEAVSASRYFVSVTQANETEEVPSSLQRETEVLVHFVLAPDGEAELIKVRPEVRAA